MSDEIIPLVSTQLADGINSGQGLGIEIIATFQLVLCVLATTDRRRSDVSGSAPLAIGLSVALGHLLAVSFNSHCISHVMVLGRIFLGVVRLLCSWPEGHTFQPAYQDHFAYNHSPYPPLKYLLSSWYITLKCSSALPIKD